jgi:hypothetical protein
MAWVRRRLQATAAAFLAVGLGFGACSGDDQASSPATDPPTPPVDALRIAEQGFSIYSDPRDGRPYLNVGFTVENTSDVTFESVHVAIHHYDASGAELENYDGAPYVVGHSIGELRPGEVEGGAKVLSLFAGEPPPVRVEVRLDQSPTEPVVADDPPRGELTATRSEVRSDGSCLWTHVAVASTYEVEVPAAYAAVIYRDEGGQIVGGAEGTLFAVPAGGEVQTETIPEGCPSATVLGVASTEAFIFPGSELFPGREPEG